MWRASDPQGAEVGKCKYDVVHYVRGRLLDIGAGPYRIFPYAITVDNLDHANRFGWKYKPDVIADSSNLSMFAKESFDSVFSSHTLEHLQDAEKNLREWWRVIKKGGYLVLYLPHKDLYPNIGTPGSNEDHKHDFTPDDVTNIMQKVGCWDLVVNEVRDNDFGPGSTLNEYSFLQVYQKGGAGQKRSCDKPKPEKKAVVIRYGGIGDMIQASSILPQLKKQGYHVTFNTTPSGMEVLKNNPNIDEFLLQDTDQVPNEELPYYWESQKRRFDKFINLSESVEGNLLSLPGRSIHAWPKEARHKVMNHNYLEMEHDIAQVEHIYEPHFFPTMEEREWAFRERTKLGGNLVVCFSLAGSSVHKTWPYIDQAIARLLVTFPECRIVLLGNHMSRILEMGWEKEPRVLRRSGEWAIRQSLTFVCTQADLVVGPETGVLNAVGMEKVGKVCFLSHSTKENLTKHWINTVSVEPPASVSCYPCHTLHYNFDHCVQDKETGVAACQAAIPVDVAWASMLGIMKKTGVLDRAPPLKQANGD
jgi:ADP-heptose:LPS heptosyltransferase/predicted SAM-dependent methyltransferase